MDASMSKTHVVLSLWSMDGYILHSEMLVKSQNPSLLSLASRKTVFHSSSIVEA